MTLPRLALSVIGDEIGPSLEEMISFAHEQGLTRLDMRTVGGRNLLGMTKEEIIKISRTLEKAGLSVPTFVSPLFKWPAAGKSMAAGKVDFAFDPTLCPAEDIIDHAIEIAVILGAPHMRIFSYLRHPGFRPSHLTDGDEFASSWTWPATTTFPSSSRTNRSATSATSPNLPPSSIRRKASPRKRNLEDGEDGEKMAEAGQRRKRKKKWWIPGKRTGRKCHLSQAPRRYRQRLGNR